LAIKNDSQFDTEISFYFMNDHNGSTFLMDPTEMSLKKNETKVNTKYSYNLHNSTPVYKHKSILVLNPLEYRVCLKPAAEVFQNRVNSVPNYIQSVQYCLYRQSQACSVDRLFAYLTLVVAHSLSLFHKTIKHLFVFTEIEHLGIPEECWQSGRHYSYLREEQPPA